MNTQGSLDHIELPPITSLTKQHQHFKTFIHLNIIYQEQVFDNQGTIHKASFDYKLQALSFRIIEKRREEECTIKRSRGG